MKKLASILLTLALLLSLSVPAFAAETTFTITVDSNRTYEVYQIFTGDLYTKTDGTKVLSNIKWGADSMPAKGETLGNKVSDTVLDELKALTSDKSDLEKLLVIEKYVNFNSTSQKTVKKDAPLNVVPGYYLLKDITENPGADQERSEYVVKVVGSFTVTAKAGTVVPDKQVQNTNDSTGTTAWADGADYDIGDAVPFKLSATITDNYDNYDSYYLCFHDTLSPGLTFNANSIVVKVTNESGGTEATTEISNTCYTVTSTNLTDDCSFHVEFENLKSVTDVKAGSVITMEYTATLGTGASFTETNKMHLEYSNDPNTTGNGETTDQEVKVYTYTLTVSKTDDDSQPLTGAGFTLYKNYKDDTTTGTWTAVGNEVTGSGTDGNEFTWKGLDNGEYKLVETTTPDGFNTMEDLYFTITSTIDDNGDLIGLTAKVSGSQDDKTFTVVTDASNTITGTITATIVNHAGTVLPETGANGTTLFLIFGSLLTLVAVVFLTVRKKMSIYED